VVSDLLHDSSHYLNSRCAFRIANYSAGGSSICDDVVLKACITTWLNGGCSAANMSNVFVTVNNTIHNCTQYSHCLDSEATQLCPSVELYNVCEAVEEPGPVLCFTSECRLG
jgi:hypothetical protein